MEKHETYLEVAGSLLEHRSSDRRANTSGAAVDAAYAHSVPDAPKSQWETLEAHLARVAERASEFAAAFGADDWGRVVGLWHDLGKYSGAFQEYIGRTADPDAGEECRASGGVDHSTFGAQYAAKVLGGHTGQIVAFCIAGHHGHLPDATSSDESNLRSTLQSRLLAGPGRVPPVHLPPMNAAPVLRFPFEPSPNRGFQVAFFTRMLFSCLIDADRTATEAFCDKSSAMERAVRKPSLGDLDLALDAFLLRKQTGAKPSRVNLIRQQALRDCLTAASLVPGFFSLNVPTGGGKTYSSLAFALRHARTHNLGRVVVAIPFTSIVEQTADAYRQALEQLADHGLVEHHSNIEPASDTRQNRLAAENWDAPLIVTTNIQLLESLFASATTPCRKLHRLAHSVIVLDEAQTIPVDLLKPTLLALQELVTNYGCTVVLCTATQPALERREGFDIGLQNVRPIIRDASEFHQSLRRIHMVRLGKLTDEVLVQRLSAEASVLCIVNTKPHAAKLHAMLKARSVSDCFHLSTFMCAQHRRDRLAEIRERLNGQRPCRLISTQLIEAGVDVDFPVVYRAPAGFDSIAQAAGRCNREGLLDAGRVFVFETESPPPAGLQRQAAQAARELMDEYDDLLASEAIEAYFRLLYWSQAHQWDKKGIVPHFSIEDNTLRFQFRSAASLYRMIEDVQTPILVPYDAQARRLRDRLQRGEPVDYLFHRAAQRYIVTVREPAVRALADNYVIAPHESGLWWLMNDRAYSPHTGLLFDRFGTNPETLML